MFSAWTHRDQGTLTDDEWSDHNPSPIHPMYNDVSPADTWLSPVNYPDDDMLFDFTQSSLLDDCAARQEQQSIIHHWRASAFPSKSASKSAAKANPLSRQPTVDDVFIAGGWEEKLIRRYQRKFGLQGLSLREVRLKMAPIEFDPVFADSDTEDEDEPPFNPDTLVDPPMRVRIPRTPSPIPTPPSASLGALSPLTPLSEPQQISPSPPVPSTPSPKSADVHCLPSPRRASPAVKRPFSDVEPEAETAPAADDVSEGEYVPSDDDEDDATYGVSKARRTPHTTHSRSSSSADKPVRGGPGRRRRPVDDTAPSQCTYVSPVDGSRCQQVFARLPEMKRHADHFHREQEARAVIEGRLPRERATLLGDNWDGTLGKPTCEGCGTEFSRRDAVKRHQNEVKARFEGGRCVWCPGTQGRKGSAKRVAAAKVGSGGSALAKKTRRK